MPWNLSASGTQTTTVGSEQTLTADVTNSVYYFECDLSAMQLGDVMQLRVYNLTLGGGTQHVAWEGVFGPSLPVTPVIPSPVLPSDQTIKVTILQIKGSARAIPWKLLRTDQTVISPNFSVKNGAVYDPSGNIHVAKGINVYGWDNTQMPYVSSNNQGQPLTTLFPGVNHVRVNSGTLSASTAGTASATYPAPSLFLTFVEQLTGYTLSGSTWTKTNPAMNIVVEIEDHDQNLGQSPFTGAALNVQTTWYQQLATYFLGNPYVWFGTQNEMGSPNFTPAGIAPGSASHVAIYNAIRNTGNNNMIQIMAGVGGSSISTVGAGAGWVIADYATMHNIVWEIHCYMTGNQPDGSMLQTPTSDTTFFSTAAGYVAGGLASTALANMFGADGGWGIIGAQSIQSADGVVPVIIGEWGPDGDAGNPGTTEGAPIVAEIISVQSQYVGATAWGWYPNYGDGGNWDCTNGGDGSSPSLTVFGTQVASTI